MANSPPAYGTVTAWRPGAYWYKNAVATPEVTVTVDGVTRPMVARTATAQERAQLWPTIVKVYRGYAGYQRNTDREIPLLILEG